MSRRDALPGGAASRPKDHQIAPSSPTASSLGHLNRRRALAHGTWEGDESDVRRIDPETRKVLERLEMPPGVGVSGLESNWRQSVLLWRRKQRQGGNRPPIQARLSGPHRLKALLDPQACGYRNLDLPSFALDGRNVVKSRHCFPKRDYPVFLGREFPSSSSGRTSPTLASSAAATASSTRSNQTNSS